MVLFLEGHKAHGKLCDHDSLLGTERNQVMLSGIRQPSRGPVECSGLFSHLMFVGTSICEIALSGFIFNLFFLIQNIL